MKLPGINYNQVNTQMTQRDVYAPIKIAGAEADAAKAMGQAVGAQAQAADASARAAMTIANNKMATAELANEFANDIVVEEAKAQLLSAQTAHKVHAMERDKRQERTNEEGIPAHETLDDYDKEQADTASTIADKMSSGMGKEAYLKYALEQNTMTLGAHVKRADSWRREANSAMRTKDVLAKADGGLFDRAWDSLEEGKGQVSQAEYYRLDKIISEASTRSTIVGQVSEALKTGNEVMAQAGYSDIGTTDWSPAKKKALQTEIMGMVSDKHQETFSAMMTATASTNVGVGGARSQGEEFIMQMEHTADDKYIGGTDGKNLSIRKVRTVLNRYAKDVESDNAVRKTIEGLQAYYAGEKLAVRSNEGNAMHNIALDLAYWGETIGTDGKLERTGDFKSDKNWTEDPEGEAIAMLNSPPIKLYGYLGDRMVSSLEGGLYGSNAKNQSAALTFLSTVMSADSSIVNAGELPPEMASLARMTQGSGGIESVQGLLKLQRENIKIPLPASFTTDVNKLLESETYANVPGFGFGMEGDNVPLSPRDKASIFEKASAFASIGVPTAEAVKLASADVVNSRMVSVMSADGNGYLADARFAVENSDAVSTVAKILEIEPQYVTEQLMEYVESDVADSGYVSMLPVTVSMDPNVPQTSDGKIHALLTGTDAVLGKFSLSVTYDVNETQLGKDAKVVINDRTEANREAIHRNKMNTNFKDLEGSLGRELVQSDLRNGDVLDMIGDFNGTNADFQKYLSDVTKESIMLTVDSLGKTPVSDHKFEVDPAVAGVKY